MIESYHELRNLVKEHKINTDIQEFQAILNKFEFLDCLENVDSFRQKIIIIDFYRENDNKTYYFICFDYKFIIIEPKYQDFLKYFYSQHKVSNIFFIPDILKTKSDIKDENTLFKQEIENFSKEFKIRNASKNIHNIWSLIRKSLSAFLIKKSYENSILNRFDELSIKIFENHEEKSSFNEKYIQLRDLGKGYGGYVILIYVILQEKIYALKMSNLAYLNDRELLNYKKINFPFIPKYYGYIIEHNTKLIVIEFVKGKTLKNININELSFIEKMKIIFEILLTFQYLHSENMIYRDLSWENIMIDENKNIILIDFDRMINSNDTNVSCDLNNEPPEIQNNKLYTFKSDIYSIGIISYYILTGIKINKIALNDLLILDDNEKLFLLCCINCNPDDRPDINLLIALFFNKFGEKIREFNVHEEYLIDILKKNIINYDQNKKIGFYTLGLIYLNNIFTLKNVNKAIDYLTLSANLEEENSYFILGQIYIDGLMNIHKDIQKSIKYLKLAAEKNHKHAQNLLGNLFLKGKEVEMNISSSIHYFSLAAKQKDSCSQYELGKIFLMEYMFKEISIKQFNILH